MTKGRQLSIRNRSGVVLFMVVAIILMMTLLTYGFLISMRTQNLAAATAGNQLQARQSRVFGSGNRLLASRRFARQSICRWRSRAQSNAFQRNSSVICWRRSRGFFVRGIRTIQPHRSANGVH